MFRYIQSVLIFFCLFVALSSCDKEISLENDGVLVGGSQSGTADYSLDGSVIACTQPVVSGGYFVGTPLDISDSVVIVVNVNTLGTYTISTAVINGMSFTGSGTFAGTGAQSVTLYGSGSPETATTSVFVPGTSGCSFIIIATGTVPPTGDFIICKVDGVSKTFNFGAGALKSGDTLSIGGLVSVSSFETIALDIIGTNAPAPGTYQAEGVDSTATAFVEAGYFGPALDIWYLDINAPTPRPNPFKVVITSMSATRVKGTFQGGMFDAGSTAEKIFTDGSFDVPVQ